MEKRRLFGNEKPKIYCVAHIHEVDKKEIDREKGLE
jgi:hypothetical protein